MPAPLLNLAAHLKFLASLPERAKYEQGDLLVPELLLDEVGTLRMFFAPFGSVNKSARVILLGLTPGWTQMEVACREARSALLEGRHQDEVLRRAKAVASFAGSMRTNLVRMLDDCGLPDLLAVRSSADLFGPAAELVHTASALRYPIFVGGRNYAGSSPRPTRHVLLLRVAREILVPELAAIPNAVIIPLGNAVEEILGALAAEGCIDRKRWVTGFPHPSGANGHRSRLFAQNRSSLATQLQQILGPMH